MSTAKDKISPSGIIIVEMIPTTSAEEQQDIDTANSVTSTTAPPHTLVTLPLDILFHLSKVLGPADSTLMGLTCQALYDVHRTIHGTVSLYTFLSGKYGPGWEPLGGILSRTWVPPKLFFVSWVSEKRFIGLDALMWATQRRARDHAPGGLSKDVDWFRYRRQLVIRGITEEELYKDYSERKEQSEDPDFDKHEKNFMSYGGGEHYVRLLYRW